MNRHLSLQQLIVTLVVSALLFAQILGLHHHLHSGDHGHAADHGSALHFADAGLHDEGHDPADTDHQPGHHAASDVEVPGVGEGLAKSLAKLLPLTLFLIVSLLLLSPIAKQVRSASGAEPAPQRHPFSLRPPSNGPPGLRLESV